MPSRPPSFRYAKPNRRRRPSAAKRLYTSQWHRQSNHVRRGLCAYCLILGLVSQAVDVDHIIPHGGDRGRFNDPDNWQGLCKIHHTAKTHAERQHGDKAHEVLTARYRAEAKRLKA